MFFSKIEIGDFKPQASYIILVELFKTCELRSENFFGSIDVSKYCENFLKNKYFSNT